MKYYRSIKDKIIISSILHFLALFYTYKDFYYSLLIIIATIFSILWHKSKESSFRLLLLDYFFAGSLTGYELCKSKNQHKYFIFLFNMFILIFNKTMDYLSKYKILDYNKGHFIYHILSVIKTVYVSKINNE